MALIDRLKSGLDAAKATVNDTAAKTSESVKAAKAKASEAIGDASAFATRQWEKMPSRQELEAWVRTVPDTIGSYADGFDADEMWQKLRTVASQAGQKLVVMVLTMYYAIEDSIGTIKNNQSRLKP